MNSSVYISMDKIMSAGYKRIVIVESDNLDINLGNNTSEDLYPR